MPKLGPLGDGLPVGICHCPECFPDPRCTCEKCIAERQRLEAAFERMSAELLERYPGLRDE